MLIFCWEQNPFVFTKLETTGLTLMQKHESWIHAAWWGTCDTWTLDVTSVDNFKNMTIDSHFLSKYPFIHSFIFCATYPLQAGGSFPSMHWPKDRVESEQKSITAYIFCLLPSNSVLSTRVYPLGCEALPLSETYTLLYSKSYCTRSQKVYHDLLLHTWNHI